jgi:hypothetical protein
MSVGHRALVVFPGGFPRQQFRGLQFHRHVGEFERHSLELADLLAELHARPHRQSVIERPLGAAEAGGGDLQAGRAQPAVGHSKPLCTSPRIWRLLQRQSSNSRTELV